VRGDGDAAVRTSVSPWRCRPGWQRAGPTR